MWGCFFLKGVSSLIALPENAALTKERMRLKCPVIQEHFDNKQYFLQHDRTCHSHHNCEIQVSQDFDLHWEYFDPKMFLPTRLKSVKILFIFSISKRLTDCGLRIKLLFTQTTTSSAHNFKLKNSFQYQSEKIWVGPAPASYPICPGHAYLAPCAAGYCNCDP